VCVPDNICGDGYITGSETCDDGNGGPGDGCSDTCEIEDKWDCDNVGNFLNIISSTCTPICGDGFKVGNEACDDGNISADIDGCNEDCSILHEGFICSFED